VLDTSGVNFGVPRSWLDPRTVQIGFKYGF
jgi:hypothetical protein